MKIYFFRFCDKNFSVFKASSLAIVYENNAEFCMEMIKNNYVYEYLKKLVSIFKMIYSFIISLFLIFLLFKYLNE